ncbi:MAG: hypothetical protein WD431_20505 [Cyclobacteriaceae bacterium]
MKEEIYPIGRKPTQTEVFSQLLDAVDENVKLWAATFTFKVKPDLAQKSLEKLTKLPSITGLSAKTTLLHLWKEGKLHLF